MKDFICYSCQKWTWTNDKVVLSLLAVHGTHSVVRLKAQPEENMNIRVVYYMYVYIAHIHVVFYHFSHPAFVNKCS